MSRAPLRVVCACARERLSASPPGQLPLVGKERAGLRERGTSPSSRLPGSWAGARVLLSGNSDREGDGGGRGREGKKGGGRGGENRRSSPNSELPLSQRVPSSYPTRACALLSRSPQRSGRNGCSSRERLRSFPKRKSVRSHAWHLLCVQKLSTAALPSSLQKKESKHTLLPRYPTPILSSLHVSKCGRSAEMWYSPASFHPPPLTPFLQLSTSLARPIPAGFGIRSRSTYLQIPVSRLRCDGNSHSISPLPSRTAVRARGGWATTKVGMGKGSYETDFWRHVTARPGHVPCASRAGAVYPGNCSFCSHLQSHSYLSLT